MHPTDYNTFTEACVEDLKLLQDKFQAEYDLNWYENWFYNQATGLLTFNTGDTELNFRYFSVGSFSTKSNTWKWAWDNDTTLDNVKQQSEAIREFGLQSNFAKLTDGYFTSDEIEAWEFAAIAAKLTNGIGVYRPVSDDYLQLFMVITEVVDNDEAQIIKDRYVQCSTHDYRRRAFVCTHINSRTKVGFEEAFDTFEDMELGDDDDFEAWCDACEKVRLHEDGWNDKSMAFAQIKLVCEKCYFDFKELNLGHK